MTEKKTLFNFIFPPLTKKFLVRASTVAIVAYLFFTYLLIPLRIRGTSMEPTYRDGSINFAWRLHYLFNEPERHDIVTLRFAGSRVMLLKRIVALPGETVEFKNGKLLVNGKNLEEPYLIYPGDWNLEPRVVEKGNVYLVGDNRNMPLKQHTFGQTSIKRIVGVPLW